MSAAAELLPQIVTTDEAIEILWEHVLNGEYADVSEAARNLWGSFRFSQDDREFLALWGLSRLAEQLQRHRRRQQAKPAIGWGAPHGKKWDQYIGLSWPYEGQPGRTKSLLEFSRDDLAAFAQRAGTQLQAWARRRDWAVQTDALLQEHGAARVCDLPASVLVEVDAAARESMGRQS